MKTIFLEHGHVGCLFETLDKRNSTVCIIFKFARAARLERFGRVKNSFFSEHGHMGYHFEALDKRNSTACKNHQFARAVRLARAKSSFK